MFFLSSDKEAQEVLISIRSSGPNLSRAFNLHAIFIQSLSSLSAVSQRSLSSLSAVSQQSLSSLSAVSQWSLSNIQ